MLDIKYIRQNPDIVKEAAKNKGVSVDVDKLLALDERRRHIQGELDLLNQERNVLADQGRNGKPSEEAIEKGKRVKVKAAELEHEYKTIDEQCKQLAYTIPNIPTADTPIGPDESGNVVIKTWGETPEFDFEPKPHWELGESLGLIDNERAAEVSGARFTYLKGGLALLEYALVQFALSILTDSKKLGEIIKNAGLDISAKAFVPVVPPIFIKPEVFEKMARLYPKEERYYIPSDDLYLIGSAEHTLGPLHMDEIIPEIKLPLRYVAFSPALRREAGAAGKDTRGIWRLHQFHKVEMESFGLPEQGTGEHSLFVAIEEYILQELNLPYQVLLKCTGDIGEPNARGVDINTWMPSQGGYRETHTADYMTDYQARRLNTRTRRADGSIEFVHMNDATAIALGRTLAAIMENFQTKEGTIEVPAVLRKYAPVDELR